MVQLPTHISPPVPTFAHSLSAPTMSYSHEEEENQIDTLKRLPGTQHEAFIHLSSVLVASFNDAAYSKNLEDLACDLRNTCSAHRC